MTTHQKLVIKMLMDELDASRGTLEETYTIVGRIINKLHGLGAIKWTVKTKKPQAPKAEPQQHMNPWQLNQYLFGATIDIEDKEEIKWIDGPKREDRIE